MERQTPNLLGLLDISLLVWKAGFGTGQNLQMADVKKKSDILCFVKCKQGGVKTEF